MWTFRIIMSYVLGAWLGMGVFGVWVAMTIDWLFRAAAFIWRYRGHKWENRKV
jgi:Na+-driven multidrug efflux pump